MKVYEGANLRNLALIGHGHAGKTSLVSAMLYTAGASQRLGRVDDGTAATDYDEEEIARKMSISTGLAFVEWGKTKINLLDTPGFNMFVHEAKMVLPVVDAALVVVDGVAGVEVVTQRVWGYCDEINLPRMIVVSRMDRERADADRVLESLTKAFGRAVTPLQLPIGSEKNFTGVVDLVRMKAYTYELGGNGKGKETEIPADLKAAAQEAHERLVELVAEGKDELMEEFFEKGTIPEEDLVPALHEAIREDKHLPRALHLRSRQHRRRRGDGLHRRLHACAGEHECGQGDRRRQWRASRRARVPTPSPHRSTFSRPCPTPSPAAFPISKFFPAC